MKNEIHTSIYLRGMHRENFAFTRENSMKLIKLTDAEQTKTVYSSKNINEKLLKTNAAIQFNGTC
jgi:hypothetical protein